MNSNGLTGLWSIFLFQLGMVKFRLELQKAKWTYPVKTGDTVGTKKYWDLRASCYDRQYGKRRDRISFLEKLLPDPKWNIKRVIELGCGTGGTLCRLAKNNPGVFFTGIDVSQEMLRRAREKANGLPNISFVERDMKDLEPELLRGHDLTVTHAVLPHLPPEIVRKVLGVVLQETRMLYLEELHVRGYRDGKELWHTGLPSGMFYNHDYLKILGNSCQIVSCQYLKGILLQLFCVIEKC